MIMSNMKPEMKYILTTLFDMDRDKYLKIKQIAEQLGVQYQEALYYVDKLARQGLAYPSGDSCYLTVEGRAYVMEKLRK